MQVWDDVVKPVTQAGGGCPLTLWYRAPSKVWIDALRIGTAHLPWRVRPNSGPIWKIRPEYRARRKVAECFVAKPAT